MTSPRPKNDPLPFKECIPPWMMKRISEIQQQEKEKQS